MPSCPLSKQAQQPPMEQQPIAGHPAAPPQRRRMQHAPRGLEDLAAVHGGNQAAEGQPTARAALRQARDRRAAGAVQRRQERALAHHRQARVLVVQRAQQLARRAVILAARDADRALLAQKLE